MVGLVWLIEDSDKKGHYNLGRVLEMFPQRENRAADVGAELKTSKLR